jgi:hypothetical protein
LDESVEQFKRSYRLFWTRGGQEVSHGLFGLVSLSAKAGDEVWLLQGCRVLVVLRPPTAQVSRACGSVDLETGLGEIKSIDPGEAVYEFVGECFILGLMDGEAIAMLRSPPKSPRPPALVGMDTEFRKIGLV